MSKIRVGLIFGGRSAEHEVSLMSARSVLAAINKDKYEVVPIGITPSGRWLSGGDPLGLLESARSELPAETRAVTLVPGPEQHELVTLDGTGPAAGVDVVFPLLHGTFGEDGTVQGLLELADLPYVGAGVLGSAVAMDKAVCKTILRAEGIPVVDWLTVTRGEIELAFEDVRRKIQAALDYPLFTKPANLGSSVGVVKVHGPDELQAALVESARYDRRVLVERGIEAREIELSVLGNDEPVASVAGEILPSREFYDYAAKYLDNTSGLLIPAPISDKALHEAQRLAIAAFRAIDCAGMARVDFLLDRNTGELYVNELNTIPGFTAISMYPKLWLASGLSYPELIDRLIQLALERHAERRKNKTSRLVG